MPRYMIEVDHDPRMASCDVAARMLLTTGSHFLTHADWGCLDGVHTAWMVVEVDTREQARAILPPLLRPAARVVGLNGFGDDLVASHGGRTTTARPRAYSSSPR